MNVPFVKEYQVLILVQLSHGNIMLTDQNKWKKYHNIYVALASINTI